MALKILLHHIDLFYKLCYFLVLSNYGLISVGESIRAFPKNLIGSSGFGISSLAIG